MALITERLLVPQTRYAFDIGTRNFAGVCAELHPPNKLLIFQAVRCDILGQPPGAKRYWNKADSLFNNLDRVLSTLPPHPTEVRIERQMSDGQYFKEIAGGVAMWAKAHGATVRFQRMCDVWKRLDIRGKRDEQGRLIYDRTKQHSFQPIEEQEALGVLEFTDPKLREDVLASPDLRDCVLHLF